MSRTLPETILVANRGEIAVRVIKTCKRLGIRTIAVYSEADRRALHVSMADQAVAIGGPKSADSYLDADKLVKAALCTGCQAVHPGYGFLSENAGFARKVVEAGLVFIGPPPAAIALLGDKLESKKLAMRLGLPVAMASVERLSSLENVKAAADSVGYPVLLKPVAGGGGKGMRIVHRPEDLEERFAECRSEAIKAFGDDGILVERFLAAARHVEVQFVTDAAGNAINLGERDCSIQRRYQKIIEEAPALGINHEARARLGKMACDIALAAGYVNAGTAEFLLTPDGSFYFMEVNARLQVEHPVTEMITGIDLVELQIRIAAGETLPLKQEDVKIEGWAIEARVCAEDPARNFLPSTGIITHFAAPAAPGVRIDSGIEAGTNISFYYDSLMAKVVAYGETRSAAREALSEALNSVLVEGVETNLNYLTAILNHPAFAEGDVSTDFLPKRFPGGVSDAQPPAGTLRRMALVSTLVFHNRRVLVRESLKPMSALVGAAPWPELWTKYIVRVGRSIFDVQIKEDAAGRIWSFRVNGYDCTVQAPMFEFYLRRVVLVINQKEFRFRVQFRGNFVEVAHDGLQDTFEVYTPLEWQLAGFMPVASAKVSDRVLECPMPGQVIRVFVKPGEQVCKRQALLVIESMKMESVISSPCDARVCDVLASEGQIVEVGTTLIKFG